MSIFRHPILDPDEVIKAHPQLTHVLGDLRLVVEQNEWHPGWTTFVHTKAVLANLHFLRTTVIGPSMRQELDANIELHTTGELLEVAALLHDIGKPQTLKIGDSKSYCPGHEEAGAIMIPAILADLGFGPTETEFVRALVQLHGKPHKVFGLTANEFPAAYKEFKGATGTAARLVALHGFADTMLSDERLTNLPSYELRMRRYMNIVAE